MTVGLGISAPRGEFLQKGFRISAPPDSSESNHPFLLNPPELFQFQRATPRAQGGLCGPTAPPAFLPPGQRQTRPWVSSLTPPDGSPCVADLRPQPHTCNDVSAARPPAWLPTGGAGEQAPGPPLLPAPRSSRTASFSPLPRLLPALQAPSRQGAPARDTPLAPWEPRPPRFQLP